MDLAPDAWKLYGILDLSYVAIEDSELVCSEMCQGGVDVIQLRAKNRPSESLLYLAKTIRRITRDNGKAFIVNDHPEFARDAEADGVHVGQEDGTIAAARELSGGLLVGRSTHSVAQACVAAREGADYIGFGPLFATSTKPNYFPIGLGDVRKVQEEVAIPVFCIGGIKIENLDAVLDAGARRVAVVSGILLADDIMEYCRALRKRLDFIS